jgi:flagellar biosynthesis protein FlhB
MSSEEKTEQPSDKKLQQSKEEGQSQQTKDIGQSFILLLFCITLLFSYSYMIDQLMNYFSSAFLYAGHSFDNYYRYLLSSGAYLVFNIVFLFSLTVLCLGWVPHVFIKGVSISFKAISPKLEKLNPVNGLKKIFSKQQLFEFFKIVILFIIILIVVFIILHNYRYTIVNLPLCLDVCTIKIFGDISLLILLSMCAIFIIASGIDTYIQRILFLKQLKMSKSEVKKEHKDSEGDPIIKNFTRGISRELLHANITDFDIKISNIFIYNNTHMIAIHLDSEFRNTPVLIAKASSKARIDKFIIVAQQNNIIMAYDDISSTIYKKINIGEYIIEDSIALPLHKIFYNLSLL